MCISTGEAAFSGTILYCGRHHHGEHGLIHVLGYQNTAVNLADGPNAMLLHVPTRQLTPHHFLSAGRSADVLHRMVSAVEDAVAAADDIVWMSAEPQAAVQVFDHDVYTVLLADDPTAIPAALWQVPPHRRPDLDPELLSFYAECFPDHTIVVCCFDNAEARRAKPLLLWYQPLDPDRLTVPALDSHTGKAPDLDAAVPVDHWVLFSTDEGPADWGAPVAYSGACATACASFSPRRSSAGTTGTGRPCRTGTSPSATLTCSTATRTASSACSRPGVDCCSALDGVREEAGPGGGGEGELRALVELGVADVDGGGAGGDLDAVVTGAAAVARLVPLQGDLDAGVAVAAAIAALEPDQGCGAHLAPRICRIRLLESSNERACERILAHRIWSALITLGSETNCPCSCPSR